jgi:dTDP-4-amino-4,6-dideoxygalactose transaminase
MIGGEYEIRWSDLYAQSKRWTLGQDEYAYASGRAALFQILRYCRQSLGIRTILIPEYVCDSVVDAARQSTLEIKTYPITDALQMDTNALGKLGAKNTAILIVNYFGMADAESQKQYIRTNYPEAIIIEDDVQAYYAYQKPLGTEHFKFTSLRKWFAVPDGGLVKTKYPMPSSAKENTFAVTKLAGATLKRIREYLNRDDVYLEMLQWGEELIDENMESGMSDIAQRLMATIDTEQIAQQRMHNACVLREGLKRIPQVKELMERREEAVPLFIPIYMNNRDEVRRAMFDAGIFCPVHWPNQQTAHAQALAQHELSLNIDQRYNEADMNRIIEIVEKYAR